MLHNLKNRKLTEKQMRIHYSSNFKVNKKCKCETSLPLVNTDDEEHAKQIQEITSMLWTEEGLKYKNFRKNHLDFKTIALLKNLKTIDAESIDQRITKKNFEVLNKDPKIEKIQIENISLKKQLENITVKCDRLTQQCIKVFEKLTDIIRNFKTSGNKEGIVNKISKIAE